MTLRIIFMGTPEFAVPTLRALAKAGHDIVACYSQPPRPGGRRGLQLVPSPVQEAAEELDIPVFVPTSLTGDVEQAEFSARAADVAVVVAYGLLLPQKILDAPRFGCFNGHASLLPRWRGAAPIQRAIMAGDRETGTMVMKMDAGLDTGPVALTTRVPITPETTASMLHDQLSVVGANLMVEAMGALEKGELRTVPQSDAGITYAQKISKGETRIDWSGPAEEVHRHIMGLSRFPGAWCSFPSDDAEFRLKVLSSSVAEGRPAAPGTVLDDRLTVACGSGAVRLTEIQKAGSKAMETERFLQGTPVEAGTVLN